MIDIKLFTGNANPLLAQRIAEQMQLPLGKIEVGRFSDNEIRVQINESVRGADIFIIQSTSYPANDNIMELMVMADAFRRASATNITAVVPYFGYARQDRRVRSSRVPITAKIVADMMASVGISRLITVDLHADQIQGFFYMPVDNVYASNAILEQVDAKERWPNLMVVSPDVGGVVRARAIAKRMNDSDLAIIDKRRPGPNVSEVMNVIGDVRGKNCLIVDDIVDTAGTLCHAAKALMNHGAASVSAYATHAVLSGQAIENVNNSCLSELLVSDTIPLSEKALGSSKIQQLSLSPIIAETIMRIENNGSVSSLFGEA